jgi:P27 family predicted phage terminase small subunit
MAGVKGMRTGGQNKKPAALHVLQGTWRKRHGRSSPEPPAGVPEPPGALQGEVQAEWNRMIVRLTAAGTLSSVDGPLLWNYVHLWADSCRLQADANALTRTWFEKTSVDGAGVEHAEPKLHPVFAALKQYRLALRVYLVEFGLTPLARNRVTPQTAAAMPSIDPKKQRYLDALQKPSA